MATETTGPWEIREKRSGNDDSPSNTDEHVGPAASSRRACPDCDGLIDPESDPPACEDCGRIVDDQPIDHGPEWYPGTSDGSKPRVGPPRTRERHDNGLTTDIGSGVDGYGTPLDSDTRRQFARFRRQHRRAKWASTRDKILAHGLGEVRRIASALGLTSSVRAQACELFRTAQSEDLLHGRSVEGVAGASTYAVCRINRRAVLVDDVATVARTGRDRVEHCYNVLNKSLELPTPPQTPATYLPRIASDVDASPAIEQRAAALAETVSTTEVMADKSPAGVAAACLYAASQELDRGSTITQQSVATAAGVSPRTVREHWSLLQNLDIPSNLKDSNSGSA